MQKRDFLKSVLLAGMGLVTKSAAGTETHPNVILLLSDDQGYGDMGCHGNPFLKTPNIDKLYSESVRLTDFHVDPMSAPTRAALMTGRYAARSGVWSTLKGCYIPNGKEVTLGDMFSNAGYKTAMFGKWHLGENYPHSALHRGFQHVIRHAGGVVGEVPDYWKNDYFDDTYLENGKRTKFNGFCTDIWFDEAMAYIESVKEQPFFCYLATNAPHGPFNVADRYADPYREMGIPEKRARFYGLIANLDENLGRLMRFLEKEELARNTILIFMGDNGTAAGVSRKRDGHCRPVSKRHGFNAGMRGTKTWPYEGGHRNACFIRWPGGGIEGGRDIEGLSAHIDLLPTLARLCNLKLPQDRKLDGISLVPQLLKSEKEIPQRTLVVQNMQLVTPRKYKDFAVMTERWRLVKTQKWSQPEAELFDIHSDPSQTRDLADKYPETVRKLMCEYEKWWKDIAPSYANVSELVVGSRYDNPVLLTCHSWRTESQEKSYNQLHVRQGILVDDAYWPIKVARSGTYRIELRRWPREADKAIRASVPAIRDEPFIEDRPAGKIFAVTKARLKIRDFDKTIPIAKREKGAIFELPLEKGKTRLQAWFKCADGRIINAYYVYLERL